MATHKAFSAFREGRFGDAADLFHQAAADAKAQNLPSVLQAAIIANAATSEKAMELNRRCLKTCDAAIAMSSSCLKASLIKGEVQLIMGKKTKALATWKSAVNRIESPETIPPPQTAQTTTSPSTPPDHPPPVVAASVITPVSPPSSKIPSSLSTTGSSKNEKLRKEALAAPVAASALAAAINAAKACGIKADSPAMMVTEGMLAQARSVLSHSSGIPSLDNAIARGYLFVNTGVYPAAIALFDELLASYPSLVACHMAKGSACAMTGNYPEAVNCFTLALAEDPSMFDAWKRRGQTQAARGNEFLSAALGDLDQAKSLAQGSDYDIYHQRGAILHRLLRYDEALVEFERFIKLEPKNSLGHNYIGLCRAQLGDYTIALKAYETSMKLDNNFREAKVNIAQLWRECGNGTRALEHFDAAYKCDPKHVQTVHLRGLCKHGLGRTEAAVADFELALKMDRSHITSRHMLALCLQSLGRFHAARPHLELLMKQDPAHIAFYNLELGTYYLSTLDNPITGHCADDEVHSLLKELQCKREDYRPQASLLTPHLRSPKQVESIKDVKSSSSSAANDSENSASFLKLIRQADQLGKFLILDCTGFLANQRQQRQAGLAILHITQRCERHFQGLAEGIQTVSDLKWREVFDIAVRWRQISEPNDPVWWIDKLSKDAFSEGFGLQTPLINGQLKVIRYYPYFGLAFDLMKDLIMKMMAQGDEVEVVRKMKTVHELYEAWGKGDFWVVSPCKSTAISGKTMEGTRLTIQKKEPNGYEFTIRTPGTPARWKEYDTELSHLWDKLQSMATSRSIREVENEGGKKTANSFDEQEMEIIETCLSIFFYWVNFGPLSRGSAACGYVVLRALLASFQFELELPWMPSQIQLDWEAILRPTPKDFMDVVKPWLLPHLTTIIAKQQVRNETPKFDEHIVTLRDAYLALNMKNET